MAVDELDQLQPAGEREQGGAGAELVDDSLERQGGDAGGLEFLEDAVGIAEVGLGDDAWEDGKSAVNNLEDGTSVSP